MKFEALMNVLFENTTTSASKKQEGSNLVSGLVTNTGVYSIPNTGTSAQVFRASTGFSTQGNTQSSFEDSNPDIVSSKKKKDKTPSLKDCFKHKVSFSKKPSRRFKASKNPQDSEGQSAFQ